jgi:peptide/nickel transport system substrate-binding protein
MLAMQNRFGIKDFILMVLVLGIGISVWFSMVQNDREWKQSEQIKIKLSDLERQLARVEGRLESGVALSEGPSMPSTGATGSRDESWARPGVPIEWQPPWTFTTDPRKQPGFTPDGEFTEAFEVQLAKLTPFIQTDVYGRRIVDLVAPALASYDPKTLRLRGVLAEAWQYDPNGYWLRAKISPRARFSDGAPVTAEDVRWTFHDFIMNQQIEAERDRSTLRDAIEKVEAIDERVVEFTFKQPLFNNLESALLQILVLPKHFYEQFNAAQINKSTGLLMGAGPYKLETLDPDNQWAPPQPVVLVRNEEYWLDKPSLAKIRYVSITNELARLTSYRNGEADMMTPAAPQFATLAQDEAFAKNNQMLNWVNMRSGNSFIAWNCGERNGKPTPFADKRVRRAMTFLLDREKMIRDIWGGLGVVSKGSSNPMSPASDQAVKPLPYDPAQAKALLKEAGWEDRDGTGVLKDAKGNEFVFEFTMAGGSEIAERIGRFVKDSCAAVGIRCNIRSMDWSVMEPMRNQRDFDALTMAWGANAPESDPKQIYHSGSIANQGDNFAQWNSPEADAAIDAARRELDFDKRMKLWHKFEAVMHDEQPYTWIRIQPYLRFIKPEIGNVHMYPKGPEVWEFFRGGATSPGSGT